MKNKTKIFLFVFAITSFIYLLFITNYKDTIKIAKKEEVKALHVTEVPKGFTGVKAYNVGRFLY